MKISCRVRGDWFHVPCADGNQIIDHKHGFIGLYFDYIEYFNYFLKNYMISIFLILDINFELPYFHE